MNEKKLGQGAVGTGSGTLLYTVPTGYKTAVTNIVISNTTAAPITFALHLVPVGVAVADSNQMFPDVSIPGNTLISWCGRQMLNAGDFIQAIGSASGVTVNITGEEERVSI